MVAIFSFGYRLGIDFSGGTALEVDLGEKQAAIPENKSVEEFLVETYEAKTEQETAAQTSGDNRYLLRSKSITNDQKNAWLAEVRTIFADVQELQFETVSPTIGGEIVRKAVIAIILTLIAIMLYLAYAFRKVPKPTSSWEFGIIAVITLLTHDVIILLGFYAVLSKYFGAEVDSMFITGLLTLLGFSVHDTIVTFDRIRENLIHHGAENFETTVNNSIVETITRSVNTSFTLVLVLLAMTLIGGGTTYFFTLTLMVGVIIGVYSSLFFAAPLLVIWHRYRERKASA